MIAKVFWVGILSRDSVITISILIPTRLYLLVNIKLLPILLEVDSKETFSFAESIVFIISGNIQVPVSGLKDSVTCSINFETNFVSAATPLAGSQPKKKLKFEIWPKSMSSIDYPRLSELSLSSAFLPSSFLLSLQHAKSIRKKTFLLCFYLALFRIKNSASIISYQFLSLSKELISTD